eukprot:760881_1
MMMHDLPYSDMFEMSFSDISPPPFETTLPEECSPKFSDQIPDTIAVDMGVFGGECGAREFVTWPTAHPPVDDCDDPVLSAPPSPRLDSGSGSDADVESGFESTASDDQPAMRSDSSGKRTVVSSAFSLVRLEAELPLSSFDVLSFLADEP